MLTAAKTLQIVSFLDMLGAGLVIPQLHDQALQLGCSHLLIGTMGAVYSGAQLIAGPIIGNFSDIKGRKSTFLLSLMICTVAYSLLGFASSIATFFALRAIIGTFKQTQLLTKSITPDYENDPKKQAVTFGRLSTLSGLGMAIGPVTSGHIVDLYPEYGFTIVTSIVGLIFAINIGLIKSLPDKTSEKDQNHNKKRKVAASLMDTLKSSINESIDEFHKVDWATYWDVFLFKLLMTFAMGMFFSNYGVFLKTKHEVSPKGLGYIITLLGGVGSLSSYFIGHINKFYKDDKDSTIKTFHVFVAVTISLIGMGLGPNLYVYLLFVIPLSIASAVFRVTGLEMIMSKGHTDHRGSVIGATESMRSLAGVVTPILAGVLNEYIGVTYAIFGAAIFAGIGSFISYRIKTRSLANKPKSH